MRIHTLLEYRWNDAGELVLVREEGFDYEGPVAECKGASNDMKNISASQKAFYDTLQSQQKQQFGNQSAILGALTAAWQPILAKGPSQFGFSKAEEAAYRTQATEGTAKEYAKAAAAVNGGLAARSGGVAIPSGADDVLRQNVAMSSAESQANKQLGITEAGYNTGRQMFQAASSALGSTAAMYNPTAFANSANSAGSSAFSSAGEINQLNQASNPWGMIGGLAGGALGTLVGGPMGGKIGASLGGMLGGAGSGTGSAIFGGGGNSWGGLFGGGGGTPPPADPNQYGFCWVAAELYGGWTAPETVTIQKYLLSPSAPVPVKHFTKLYAQKGREWAREIKQNLVARAKFRELFDHFLAEATA